MEEHLENEEQTQSKNIITLFGEPIIKTRCQRNAFIYGISGGIVSGLITFLVTSSGKTATRVGVIGYGAISITLACFCTYEELKMRSQARLLKKVMYEMSMSKGDQKMKLDYSQKKFESD
ncbi:Cytochrome c oxidase protein 20 like protein [Habropoda laboriosa]|uniref:Cytochrome c oxidase assembly protein COX20, mitochondrial n=1 Tax=Habropoda laboriosa TaxID=597456 RepID=A0A0L7QMS5_9HYME|nr:Cytochrome c oxidase protein 20 like protein [Habropoda laboriosa]